MNESTFGDDLRRKINREDYARIRFQLWQQNLTIRDVASEFQITTKHAKKIEAGHYNFNPDGTTTFVMPTAYEEISANPWIPARFSCSGCGYSFGSSSGLMLHFAIYTSGGMKALDCMHL